ncbi:MAG: proteasome subunit beta [Proteobacteria bacterium]|nr:proteasome subunit beta [Pseudomonadota bacterium]
MEGTLIFNGSYRGSSFWEMLQVDASHLLPDFTALAGDGSVQIPHGTTVLAFKYNDGVLVAGDRLATEGHRVASRDVQKVFATDKYSLMAISGAAGPCIEMARILSVELEHYEKIEGERLEIEGKANKLSQMIRQNLPAAMQGLVVVPLFAGYDLRRRTGRIWKFDITGGRYEETDFEATGSGGLYAHESLKKTWRSDLSKSEALRAAVGALADASDEDRATGGIDLTRRIFPIVKFCSEQGMEDGSNEEMESAYLKILERRANGNGGARA